MDDATSTATVTITPASGRATAIVTIDGERYEGEVHDSTGAPDPTAWTTGDLSLCPRDVLTYLSSADLTVASKETIEL